jgi:Hint domain
MAWARWVLLLPKRVKFMMTSCANGYNELGLPKRWGSTMTTELENLDAGTQRTRRNIMKMGAIAVPVTLATVHSAAASTSNEFCISVLGIKVCVDLPGGGGKGGNCFLKGTRILTAEGERKIEDLAIGDLLPTMFGGMRPVQWIGRYSIKKSDPSKPWVKDVLPIRIARSALAPNVPHADLYVTALHSLLIDGVLAPAEMLINGTTITRYEASEYEELEYFHIKLESHDVVYAEGAPVETLLHVEEFAVNFAEYLRQYGTPAAEEARCAPLVQIGGRRRELRSRFRSALSPFIDIRNQADVIRDRVEERGVMMSRQAELAH